MADQAQLTNLISDARGEVKRLANQTRRTNRALAQLEAELAERGISLEITAPGGTDE